MLGYFRFIAVSSRIEVAGFDAERARLSEAKRLQKLGRVMLAQESGASQLSIYVYR
jgi:hypothetical protein